MSWVQTTLLTVNVLALVLHFGCLCLLHKDRSPIIRQKTFLIKNLCICDAAFALFSIVRIIMKIFAEKYMKYLTVVIFGVGKAWITAMFLLTLERFYKFRYPLTYARTRFEHWKQKICLFSWLFGLCYIIALSITKTYADAETLEVVINIRDTLWAGFDFLVAIEFIIVYAYIFKVGKDWSERRRQRGLSTSDKNLIVPFLIVLTFILFVAVPDMIVTFRTDVPHDDLIYLIHGLNHVSDALIYVIGNENERKKLLSVIKRKKSDGNQTDATTITLATTDMKTF